VEVHLQNYPDVKKQATATLTVTECVVTSITADTSVESGSTYSYTISSTPLEIPYVYAQVPACGYAMTVAHTEAPVSAAVDHDDTNSKFTVNSTDLADVAAGVSVNVTIDVGG